MLDLGNVAFKIAYRELLKSSRESVACIAEVRESIFEDILLGLGFILSELGLCWSVTGVVYGSLIRLLSI